MDRSAQDDDSFGFSASFTPIYIIGVVSASGWFFLCGLEFDASSRLPQNVG
jgi:hypothetical protein